MLLHSNKAPPPRTISPESVRRRVAKNSLPDLNTALSGVTKTDKQLANGALASESISGGSSFSPPTLDTPAARYDGDSALKLYLREAAESKLITPQEEIELAVKIKKGDAQARETMIKANLRLVVKIAKDYEGYGLPLLDLINEGNIGLMKAVERFNPNMGAKLSTYGSWWIKQAIKRALANQSKTIRLPVHLVDKINRMWRTENKLHEELGREPTDSELGAEMRLPSSRIAEYRRYAARLASLDSKLGPDEDSITLGDLVEDTGVKDAARELLDKTGRNDLMTLLDELTERERTILTHRFGLNGSTEKTLEEVGKMLGVTRERIRQVQDKALKKMRHKFARLDRVNI